jgi:hypothetical protein
MIISTILVVVQVIEPGVLVEMTVELFQLHSAVLFVWAFCLRKIHADPPELVTTDHQNDTWFASLLPNSGYFIGSPDCVRQSHLS